MTVLVYQDYLSNKGALYRSLFRHFGSPNVAFCDADDLKNDCLTDAIKLFVMPGGADLYYCEKLNGAPASSIRNWVETGGCYLGICAGAYFGCAEIEWAKGKDQEITGSRELSFFKGKAVGPIYKFIEEQNINKSWQGSPILTYNDEEITETTSVFYEGGPVFIPDANDCDFTVLASYDGLDSPNAAIIECRAGKGKAILCSPHLEQTAEDLEKGLYHHNNPSFEWEAGIAQNMAQSEATGRRLWAHLLNRCVGKL